MKSYLLTPAAVLALLLAAGCSDRGDTNARNAEEEKTPAAAAAAEEGAPASRDAAAAREAEDTSGARATAGTRANRAAKPGGAASTARSNAAAPRSDAGTSARESEAPSASPGRRAVEWHEVTIPSGTALPLELETALSSETAQIEAPVRARLTQAVVVNGVTALPAGATVSGEVTNVQRAGKVKGRSALSFSFSQIRADNFSSGIKTAALSYVGEASKGEDATKIGAGAIGGAIVGGIIGGGDGAAKGAAIGGAAGTGVVLATRGKEVELASGTDLAATLAAPLSVRVPVSR